MDFLKKNWLQLIGLLFIIVMAFVVGRSCGGGRQSGVDSREVDSLRTAKAAAEEQFNQRLAAEVRRGDSLERIRVVTQNRAQQARGGVSQAIAHGKRIIAKTPADSPHVANCDSLAAAFLDLAETAQNQSEVMDTMVVEHARQLAGKDSIIALQGQHIFNLNAQNLVLENKYNLLAVDYAKALRGKKRNGTFAKILGGALAIKVGIDILKK
jgi:hypothetical protein